MTYPCKHGVTRYCQPCESEAANAGSLERVVSRNMNAKIKVTFDMSFATDGECKTQVSFELPDRPDVPCPDNLKKILIGEIKMLCGAMDAAGEQLFSAND